MSCFPLLGLLQGLDLLFSLSEATLKVSARCDLEESSANPLAICALAQQTGFHSFLRLGGLNVGWVEKNNGLQMMKNSNVQLQVLSGVFAIAKGFQRAPVGGSRSSC